MALFDDLVQPETKKTGIFADLVGSTAVAEPPLRMAGMDFDPSKLPPIDTSHMDFSIPGMEPRDPLWKRGAKNIYGEMTNILKPDLPPVREIGQRNQMAEERAAKEAGGDSEKFFALREKYMNEYQARVTQGSGYVPTVPPAQTPGEALTDIPTKLAPMVAKIAGLTALGVPAPFAWEFENLTGGGAPGKGIAMQGILKGAEGLKVHPALKPAVPGTIFAAEAAIGGGSPQEIATAFLIPYAFKMLDLPKYAVDKLRAKGRANIISNMRQMLKDKGIDESKIPDQALDAILTAAQQAKGWNSALKKGKITPEVHVKRIDEIYKGLEPIFSAIGKGQPAKGKPATGPTLRIKPPNIVREKSPGVGGGLKVLPETGTQKGQAPVPPPPRVSPKPDTSMEPRGAFVKGDGFIMYPDGRKLITPPSHQTEKEGLIEELAAKSAKGGSSGAAAKRKLDALVQEDPGLKQAADGAYYDALMEESNNGRSSATDKLNTLVQDQRPPTYDELLEKSQEGDTEATQMLRDGRYSQPQPPRAEPKTKTGTVEGSKETTPQIESQETTGITGLSDKELDRRVGEIVTGKPDMTDKEIQAARNKELGEIDNQMAAEDKITEKNLKEAEKKIEGQFSIEPVKPEIDIENLDEVRKNQIELLDKYVGQLKITPNGDVRHVDRITNAAILRVVRQVDAPYEEVLAETYKTAKKMLASSDNSWSAGVESTADTAGLTGVERARHFLIGSSNTPNTPLTKVRNKLAEQGAHYVCMEPDCQSQYKKKDNIRRHLQEKHGITENYQNHYKRIKPQLESQLAPPDGEDITLLEEWENGMPLPILNEIELSFMRNADEHGDISRAFPFRGSRMPADPEMSYGMVESIATQLLLTEARDFPSPERPSFEFNYQGETVKIEPSPLSQQERQKLEDLIKEANSQNILPFPYAYQKMLSSSKYTPALERIWDQSKKMLHQAATRIWKARHVEPGQVPEDARSRDYLEFSPKEKGITKRGNSFKLNLRLKGRNITGTYPTMEEAIEAKKQHFIDIYGEDYSRYSLQRMPSENAYPDLNDAVENRLASASIQPRFKVIGKTVDSDERLLQKMEKSSHAGDQTIDFRPGEEQTVTNKELIISNVGETVYEQNKDAKWIIAGRTFVDSDTGRITHEIYTKGVGRARVVAEEGYHPIVEAIRITSPKDFKRVQQWHALRPGHASQDPIEGFTKLLSLIETGAYKGKLLKDLMSSDLGGVINLAQRLFSGKEKLTPEVLEKVKAVLPKGRSGVGSEGIYSIEPKDRKRAGFARLPEDILSKLPKSLQGKVTRQKRSRGGFADFSQLYEEKNKKGSDPQKRKAQEEIEEASKLAIDIVRKLPKGVLSILEPSKIVEMRQGKDVYADVVQGTFGKAEKKGIEFGEEKITKLDATIDELQDWFAEYPKSDLKNFMIARGTPWTEDGKTVQADATQKLPQEMLHSTLNKAIQIIADRNYKYLTSVAGDDISYVQDYFYGIYKNPDQVDQFLDYYRTTKRFTQEKKLPTVADAVAYGLELRNWNPVSNLRAEWSGIARLEGMIWMRDSLLEKGKGKYIEDDVAAPSHWVRIAKGTEPVFKDYRVDPDLGRMINNLIATNKVTGNVALMTLREINNVLRIVKFAGSIFHSMVEISQAVADNPYGQPVRKSSLAGLQSGFKKNDPAFKTPEYREYVQLGGQHKYSAESQSVETMDKILNVLASMPVLRIAGKPFKKLMLSKVPPFPGFAKWMFNSWIPKIKYTKYLDNVALIEKKLGRQLLAQEKIDIIKEGQNFYGEMNERLFGRSSTLTSIARFVFLAPGFAEGNYRTILKGAVQWGQKGGQKAHRSRANVINSLGIKAIMATIATAIITGKLPQAPKSAEDIRDLWKIDTGKKDDKGRRILIDTLTYDKDYANFIVSLISGRPDRFVADTWRRLGGMKAPLFDIGLDMVEMSMGRSIYDWKGDSVLEITDPFLKKFAKLVAYETAKIEPISVSVFKQAREKELDKAAALIQSFSGVRPTYTEKDIREKQVLHKIYSLKGQQEELYQYLRTMKDPRGAIEDYNYTVKDILSSKFVPKEMRDEWEPDLLVDPDRLVKNKRDEFRSASHTKLEADRIREFLVNFDEPVPPSIWDAGGDLPERLGDFVEYRRTLNRQKESLSDKKKTLLAQLNRIQTNLTKLSYAIGESKDVSRRQSLLKTAEKNLDQADKLRVD